MNHPSARSSTTKATPCQTYYMKLAPKPSPLHNGNFAQEDQALGE